MGGEEPMNTLKIYLDKKRDMKVAVRRIDRYLYIKGYYCNRGCSSCHLYTKGDEIDEDRHCKFIDAKASIIMKVEDHKNETIQLT